MSAASHFLDWVESRRVRGVRGQGSVRVRVRVRVRVSKCVCKAVRV